MGIPKLDEDLIIYDLKILERVTHLDRYKRWKCRCTCGNVFYPIESNVKRGLVKSCGNCGKNYYRLLPDGVSVEITATNGYKFYIDQTDVEKAKRYKWSVSRAADGVISVTNSKGEGISTFLMDSHAPYEVDHKDRNRLNNRRSNLRICTHQQNRFNHNLQKNNTSGVSGVRLNKARNKYVARIKFCGYDVHLGYYKDFESAVQARNAGADFLFDDFGVIEKEVPRPSDDVLDYVKMQCEKAINRVKKEGFKK